MRVLPSSWEPWNFSMESEAASLLVKRTVPQPCDNTTRPQHTRQQHQQPSKAMAMMHDDRETAL